MSISFVNSYLKSHPYLLLSVFMKYRFAACVRDEVSRACVLDYFDCVEAPHLTPELHFAGLRSRDWG